MTKTEVKNLINSMVPALVKSGINSYLNDLSKQEESDWSKKEGCFTKAKEAGITDGTSPQSPITREQAVAMLSRMDKKANLGVINKKEG